jgi:zinc transporter ZupT
MVALIASFFSLCVGPLVYQTFGPLRRTDKIVSGIVLVVVAGVIIFEVIPHTFEAIYYWALLLPLIGFAGPTIIERTFRRAADTTHKLTIYLGLFGLLLHAFIDGSALQAEQSNVNNGLTLAIVIHRLPVGLTIWWMLKPLLGERYALVTLLLMGAATFAGYGSSHLIGDYQNSTTFAIIQAFIAGSLLHVVFHKPHADGCMHTDTSHIEHVAGDIHHTHSQHVVNDHSHLDADGHSHNDDINIQSATLDTSIKQQINLAQNIKAKIMRWESLGMFVGAIILLIIFYHHD